VPRSPQRTDGYAPIRDYALIGNKRTAALVALDGAIDWFCPAGFDGPSVFAAMVDSRRGGAFQLAPTAPFTAERRYLPDTNVLETTFTTAEGAVRVTDAMSRPAARTLDFSEIVRKVDGLSGEVELRWRVQPRFGYGQRQGRSLHRAGVPLIVDGDQALAVQAHGAGEVHADDAAVHGRFACPDGHVAVLALSCFERGPLAFSSAEQLVKRVEATADHWRRWAAGCTYDGPWREAVVRSALALDLMIDEQTSAAVAAPTLGLPEHVGGSRNFDYRYAWLRDGNLTLEAMLRLGFGEQVHASLTWMLRAAARTHPRLRPICRLDGRPRLPDAELDLPGYRDSRPVTLGNSAQAQLQLGTYGDVFDMVWKYVEDGNALGGESAVRLAELADYVCLVWDKPDAGLWELGDEQHYTQSKLACALALQRARQLAERGMVPDAGVPRWRRAEDDIDRFTHERCWNERLRAYARAADSDELDAAVLLAARGRLADDEPERLSATVDAVLDGLGAGDGLVYRYTGMQEEEGAFLACSFWAAEALARCRRIDEAMTAMGTLVDLANDVGLYSEEIDPGTKALLGNMPQALTHLALVNAADVCRQALEGEDGAVGHPTATGQDRPPRVVSEA
jgi:GH15 family glucan-1,4-alpha-glucosidase